MQIFNRLRIWHPHGHASNILIAIIVYLQRLANQRYCEWHEQAMAST